MHLTKEEERLLDSENETISECMRILVTLGKFFDADRLIDIKSAHISGISYANIKDEGLEWLKSLKARFKVPTTINPAGMDMERWREMGIDHNFYLKQKEIIETFKRLGAETLLTCTPYYIKKVEFGEHIAWSESSAVVYANSILGAMTNKESGISALAAAIIGKTPNYGLHIKENRMPTILVKVKGDLSAAGYIAGESLSNEVPYFVFDRKVAKWELKLLGASLASTGNVSMFHAEGITPEWRDFEKPKEKIEIEGKLDFDCDPDLIAIGCPHVSDDELKLILDLIEGKRVKKELWIFTSRDIVNRNRKIVEKIERLGAKVFCDTCIVVSTACEKYDCVLVNSGKALHYLPKLRGVEVSFSDLKRCLEVATDG